MINEILAFIFLYFLSAGVLHFSEDDVLQKRKWIPIINMVLLAIVAIIFIILIIVIICVICYNYIIPSKTSQNEKN